MKVERNIISKDLCEQYCMGQKHIVQKIIISVMF